jgi:potassium efflux system protein
MERGILTFLSGRDRSTRLLTNPILIQIGLSLFLLSSVAAAQNGLFDPLGIASEKSRNEADRRSDQQSKGDPLLAIEQALAEAQQRLASLDSARRAGDDQADSQPSPARESSVRLVRVLEQRREAQIRTNNLNIGRAAIEMGLARDPSELFGAPPPFPVPVLDGVLQSWRREADQESKHRIVLDDLQANLQLAREIASGLEKDRRRLRDVLEKAPEDVEKIRLEAELRMLADQILIAREQVALAEQRVLNATIEHDIKGIATRQARAALTWVEAHLSPRDADLADAIERIDRDRFELDREIDLARSRLIASESILRATEERTGLIDSKAEVEFSLELAARRRLLSHRQHIVALLNERIERLGRMRTTWQRRYAVLGNRLDLDEAPGWRDAAENELERLTRLRRIHETELAQLRLELATLLRDVTLPNAPDSVRWLKLEIEDLEVLAGIYQSDLATVDTAIQLEDRLRAELLARLNDRNLGERMRGFAENLRSFWSFELTTSADRPITPGKILIALAVFTIGYLFARFMMRILARRFFPRLGFDAGASNAFASLTFYALLGVAFLYALRAVSIPLTAFAVVGGALALGIGFGSQAIVSNFISGLLLLAERPIRTGDLVEIAGVVGTVETIGLRSTRVRTADNFHIIVPNASFLEANVINWTHQDPRMRLRIRVGVAYGSATRDVERVLVEAAAAHLRTLDHPAPAVYFNDFADSALLFEIRFWIRYDERTDRSAILSDIRFRIDQLFAENGIVIAFPQMDVHLDGIGGIATALTPRRDPGLPRTGPEVPS